jgi:hypothetical protein
MDKTEGALHKAALIFVQNLLRLAEGERLLIYVDGGSDWTTARAIQSSAKQIGAPTDMYELPPNLRLPDVLAELTHRIESGGYDAVCELSERYFYPTKVWRRALQMGSRVYSLGPLDEDAFIRCVGQVDHSLMYEYGLALRKALRQARAVRVVSRQGTDLQSRLDPPGIARRLLSRLRVSQTAWVGLPSGMLREGRNSTFLGGQLAFQGVPESIAGTAVIDTHLWPPEGIGPLELPITITIRKGSVVEIAGPSPNSKILSRWLDGKDKRIRHFCLGFHPGARAYGSLMEVERLFGCISVGIGKYPFHTDGIIKCPSIWLDDRMIEREGTLVEDDLSALGTELIQSYHGSPGDAPAWMASAAPGDNEEA